MRQETVSVSGDCECVRSVNKQQDGRYIRLRVREAVEERLVQCQLPPLLISTFRVNSLPKTTFFSVVYRCIKRKKYSMPCQYICPPVNIHLD